MKDRGRLELIAIGAVFCAATGAALLAGRDARALNKPPAPQQTIAGSGKASDSPLACNIRALDPSQRARVHVLVTELRAKVQAVNELPYGYVIGLPREGQLIQHAAEYIALERQCCPFFDFTLEAVREGGPVWLKLTGREGVKEFARLEFRLRVRPASAASDEASGAASGTAKESPLVCNDKALDSAQWLRLGALLTSFRAKKQEAMELPDGYAIRLPAESAAVRDVAEYMTLVGQCSPYFGVAMEVGCDGGPVWLKITGRSGVKELARRELGI